MSMNDRNFMFRCEEKYNTHLDWVFNRDERVVDVTLRVHLENEEYDYLGRSTSLQHLAVYDDKYGDEHVAMLPRKLKSLSIGSKQVTALGLSAISSINTIEELSCRHWSIPECEWGMLCSMRSLRHLSVAKCPQFRISALACCENLEEATIADALLEVQDLAEFRWDHRLRVLQLFDCRPASDVRLSMLSNLQRLESLAVVRGAWTTEAFTDIRFLKTLKQLSISHLPSVGDDVMPHVTQLHHLEWLGLDATTVTDAGMPCLSRGSKLRFVSVRGTGVTADGAKCVESQVPGLRIDVD